MGLGSIVANEVNCQVDTFAIVARFRAALLVVNLRRWGFQLLLLCWSWGFEGSRLRFSFDLMNHWNYVFVGRGQELEVKF